MANERISMGINLRPNKNTTNSGYGKYYPEVDTQKALSLRGFAQHLTDHGCLFTRDIVEGVLQKIVECLPELVAMGVPVKFDALGTFYPTAQVEKHAAVADIAAMDGLNPNDIVRGIRLRFRPDQTKLDNLCGPKFKERCSLELRNIVDTVPVLVNGKVKKMQTLKPIATAVAEWKAENAEPGNTGGSTGGNTGGTTPTPDTPGGNTGGDNGGGNNGGGDGDGNGSDE